MGGRNLGHGVPGIVVRLADKRSEQLTNHHLFARPHDRKCKDAVKFDPAIGCGLEITTQITLPFEVAKMNSLPFPKLSLNAWRRSRRIERAI